MTSLAEVERDFQSSMQVASAAAKRDFITVWPLLDMDDLDFSFTNNYAQIAQMVVAQHRSRMIDAAIEYYAQMRELAGIVDTWGVERIVDTLPDELVAWLLRAGPIAIKTALRKGWSLERALAAALVGSAGVVDKAVLDGARAQILANVRRDPRATGWSRVSYSKKPCAFCGMLISRGPVYGSRSTAGFKAHRHCHCLPRPLWNRGAEATAQQQRLEALWRAAQPDDRDPFDPDPSNTALNAFRRYLYAQ